MGTDKATLQTVNDMLKAQLREATADRASKASRIAELERQLVHRETLLAEAQQQLDAARGGHTGGHINGHTHSSISGAAPSGLLGGGSKSSSIPGGLSLGLSSSVSLPIGTMSSVFYSTGGLGGGGGGAGGGGGGTGNGMGAPTRLTPLPPPEPKDIWGSVSPVLTAGGARSHVPVAGGLNGPNGLNGGAANGQAAAPVVPGLVMVNGFIKAGGGGATGSTGSAIASQFGRGPAAGRGALTPQAIEAAQSLGLSSAYSEDFSGSEPDDAEDRD
ncbi:hypothetical protein HXX76_013706 [Chlamydomonas incerta]|uniref:Uncharacterized protein n=1 Tax=Chlamydomonas incerta TaxID=51695 RepID=A0A835SDX4_CHLIN|nr:hypothetical protein HXX76_013706 [Chlamydomonas incerta]|eukprot:KAG2425497.1 hypothetical protein HXX76_013706 [Chlamydomonas incerta]